MTTEQTDPPEQEHPKLNPGMHPIRDPERARALAAKSHEARRTNAATRKAEAAAARTANKDLTRAEEQIGVLRAQLVEAKADARTARHTANSIARRLEQELEAHARTREHLAQRTPTRTTDTTTPAEALDRAALGSVQALASVLRSLATAARGGELWRSGADAGAALDAIVRASAALTALSERARSTPARPGRVSATAAAGAIEVQSIDLAGLVEQVRGSLPAS